MSAAAAKKRNLVRMGLTKIENRGKFILSQQSTTGLELSQKYVGTAFSGIFETFYETA